MSSYVLKYTPNNNNKCKKAVKPQRKQKVPTKLSVKQMAPETARAPGDIIHTLGSTNKMVMNDDNYMGCRLAAMAPQSASSLPDGKGGKHISSCYWTTDTIVCGSGGGTWNLFLVPWLPSPLLINGNTAGTVNGVVVPSASSNAVSGFGCPGALLSTGLPITGWTTAPGYASINPNNAVSVRFSSIGMRIRYTGPAATCAGTIRVTKYPLTLSNPLTTTAYSSNSTMPTSGVFLTQTTRTGTLTNTAETGTVVYDLAPGQLSTPAPTCGVQFFRPEQGVAVRLSHKGTEYKAVPWNDTNVGISLNPTKTTTATQLNNAFWAAYSDQTNTQGGVCAFDNDWEPVAVSILNPNADASYIIETCVCCELTPSATSQFYPLAKETKAKSPNLIKIVDNIINKQGPAVPLNQLPTTMPR